MDKTRKALNQIRSLIGAQNVIVNLDHLTRYSHDEFAGPLETVKLPVAVFKPETTAQVSSILMVCNQYNVPVTPRGGGTGLCGGCVLINGGFVLSLERLNRIIEVDTDNLIAVVEAGVTLAQFYQAVESAGLFFPPHPGDESAMIGGVIATNAGGARAVKYGVVRNFVKGVEVVLANGMVTAIGGKFIKNSTGYSLLHLIVGSEGTLGIVTQATIYLMPPPKVIKTLVIPFNSLAAAISAVPDILQRKILPMAVEFIESEPIRIAEQALNIQWPCAEGVAHLMIILDGPDEDALLREAGLISQICTERGAVDVFVAEDQKRQHDILKLRSCLYETLKKYMVEILDVSIPRARIADFVRDTEALAKEMDTWLPTYGHAADGNIHTHLMSHRWSWQDGWREISGHRQKFPVLRDRIHAIGKAYGGVVSGEHGIGLVKKKFLRAFLDKEQVRLMQAIKTVFDPNHILNPGKIFDF